MGLQQNWVRLCRLLDIGDGDARGFDPDLGGKDTLFVIRQGESFTAYYNSCPHKGYEGTGIAWRKHAYLNSARDRVFCSAHGAEFDIQTGECFKGPCKGKALSRANVRLADDGFLYWDSNH